MIRQLLTFIGEALLALLIFYSPMSSADTKIDVQVSNVPLTSVLMQLAKQANISLIMQGNIDSQVHIYWQGMPAREALGNLCEIVAVQCIWRTGSQPSQWQNATDLMVMAAAEQIQAMQAPFITHVLPLHYAKAQKIADTLNGEIKILAGGKALVDQRSEQLILWLPSAHLPQVLSLIDALDQPLPQVQIEARIVIARKDASSHLRRGLQSTISKQLNLNAGSASLGLASSASSAALSLGIVAPHIKLSLELAALEASGQVLTLAQPQVVVQSGKQGKIATGQEVPFITQEGGKTTHQWKQAVLGLTVTPMVLPNQEVQMDLEVVQDSVGELLANGALALNTHKLQTQVRIAPGQTLVLGGALYEQQLEKLLKNPNWMALPWFGNWLHQQRQQLQRIELLVFVTPRLANP